MVTLNKTWLQLPADGELSGMQLNYTWLRDNCDCEHCHHPDTDERLLFSASIPSDIAPATAEMTPEALRVVWNHGAHESHYPLKWLREHAQARPTTYFDAAKPQPVLWANELESQIPRFEYSALREDDAELLAWCEALRDFGLTVISNAPREEGEIERFAEHVAVVRETIYDRLHNVRATPGEYNAYNVASTALELKPHTDMPNYNNPPGVQMFHFLVNESDGGESTAVDGYKVAADLREQDPEAFAVLANTPVEFRMYSSRGDVRSANPLLTLDCAGALKIVRFSNQLALPLRMGVDETESFYRAYRKFGQMIDSPEYKIQFKMRSGDIMVTNNLRVMHGRNAFVPNSGARHLQLSYIDFDDVLSRIRLLSAANPHH